MLYHQYSYVQNWQIFNVSVHYGLYGNSLATVTLHALDSSITYSACCGWPVVY